VSSSIATGGATARGFFLAAPWRLLAGCTGLAVAAVATLLVGVPWLGTPGAVMVSGVGLMGLAVGYGLSGWKYRRGLASLYDGLVSAQDGNLKPVPVPRLSDPMLHRLYRDYNQTITTLSGMFALVEECQHRVLDERNRMNVVVQVLPAALLGVDDNLMINTTNKQAEILLGQRERDLVGASLFDILRLDEGPREILRDAFLYQQNIRNQVIPLGLSGEDRWVSMNLSFVTEGGGGMAAVITMLDITEYRHLQESVYIREKLVAMGQLAAGVAHELNTPLGSILGYSQLLLQAGDDSARTKRYAHVISAESKRCSRIVHNLLNYARKEQCQGDRCELHGLINEVVDTLESCRLKQCNIQVERDLPGNPVVDGGCGGLDIVLTNLLVNSVRALENVQLPTIRIRTRESKGEWVTVEVEDNGPGIPPELRTRIFEPFFTTTDVGEGNGLGLSISHAMVARRGGELRLDPDYEAGARFVVRLPKSTRGTLR
jgi:two-component system NtrC family sensor kinase